MVIGVPHLDVKNTPPGGQPLAFPFRLGGGVLLGTPAIPIPRRRRPKTSYFHTPGVGLFSPPRGGFSVVFLTDQKRHF
jgi:hypothetical protein